MSEEEIDLEIMKKKIQRMDFDTISYCEHMMRSSDAELPRTGWKDRKDAIYETIKSNTKKKMELMREHTKKYPDK